MNIKNEVGINDQDKIPTNSADPYKPLPTQAVSDVGLNCADHDLFTPVGGKYIYFKRSYNRILLSSIVYWDNATNIFYLPNNPY